MQALQKTIFPILLGSLAIVVAAYIMTDNSAERFKLFTEMTKDFGVVIIGISIVSVVWWIMGGDPTEINMNKIALRLDKTAEGLSQISKIAASSEKNGLVNVGYNQDELGYSPTDLAKDINNATHSIDIMGVVLNIIHSNDQVFAALRAKAESNVPIRIMGAGVKGQYVSAIFDDRYQREVDTGSSSLFGILLPLKEKIEVRSLNKKVLAFSMIRVDDYMLVSPYLNATQSTEAPRFAIRGESSPLFKVYRKEFDALFALADSI